MKVSNNHQATSFKALNLGYLSPFAKKELVDPSLHDLEVLAKNADIKLDSVIIPRGIKEIGVPGIKFEITSHENWRTRLFHSPLKHVEEMMEIPEGCIPLNILSLKIRHVMKQMKIIK